MKSREDKIIEKIVQKGAPPRAVTLEMVKSEAVRRAKEDGYARIVYMTVGAVLRIRLMGQDKSGDQTSLCHVGHTGKIVDII